MKEQLAQLPTLLTAHLQLVLVALLLGASCSIPLGIVVARRPRLQAWVMTAASLVQTVPSLALLAIMVPLLATLGAYSEQHFGVAISSIGYLPALIALTLYSMLPMLRNTVTGLLGVDAALVEAARGVGMTPSQALWRVELPQALPVVVAGLRTATSWVVGMAVLATPVGATSLGNYIFTGLQTRNFHAVLVGCLAAAALALALDGLIRAIELALQRRRRYQLSAALAALLVLYGYVATTAASAGLSTSPALRVGAKTFTEQFILAEVLGQTLQHHAGASVRLVQSLGSNVVYDALKRDDIDVYVEYTGTVWTSMMHRSSTGAPREQILHEVETFLRDDGNVAIAAVLGFENTYTLAMREADAQSLGIASLADLAREAGQMTIASDYEFFGRSEWFDLQKAYGLAFARERSMDPALMYSSIDQGDVGVITAYTTDGRIAANHLRVLDEPQHVIPPYDAVVLVGPKLQKNPRALQALRALTGRIDLQTMQRLNYAVDHDRQSAAQAARSFLTSPSASR